MNEKGPCIVQRDCTILLQKDHPAFEEARHELSKFAELLKSPAHYHTYRITPLSLWNAAAGGLTGERVVSQLRSLARWEVPSKVVSDIIRWMSRYGCLTLCKDERDPQLLYLEARKGQEELLQEIVQERSLVAFGVQWDQGDLGSRLLIKARHRGLFKQEMARIGYPVMDEVGYHGGNKLRFKMRSMLSSGEAFELRSYQKKGVEAFVGSEAQPESGGSGVLVLPCGAGKTIIGIAAMERLQCETLILTSNVTSVRQWVQEICSKTTLPPEVVGEYSGARKQVRPVTVSTYQLLTHRFRKDEEFKHMGLFNERDWGLIIYDEVHLLPAPVFRATADIQATRRLGLTATLVREDGCERDVFSLIGPKLYEVPWRELESPGYIASAECYEIRVHMEPLLRKQYESSGSRERFRIASENPNKIRWIKYLLQAHRDRQVIIIGQYLDQLKRVASELDAPLITGTMPQNERMRLFQRFREGSIHVLVVSKVANFAVDLPEASVAVQISGSFGSRQEEAQRIGRILRPKGDGKTAYFYTLISEDSREQDFAYRRQLFLIEQGYAYKRVCEHDLAPALTLEPGDIEIGSRVLNIAQDVSINLK